MKDIEESVRILRPEPGDLLVLKVDHFLTDDQRERLRQTLAPKFEAIGCKFVVLEGGIDVQLIKQAAVHDLALSTASAQAR